MNIIIPMAGRGSRLRPHTLTIPKPLVPVGGKPIVHRLVEDIASVLSSSIENIVFIIGDFGNETEKELLEVAQKVGAKGHIRYQKEPKGTAHAVHCAKEFLEGPVVVAFADTLFKASFKINSNDQGILWVKQIDDPSAFGVIKLNDKGNIIDFVEKPKTFVSDLAMIGIYYFKDAGLLKNEIQFLFDNKIIKGGEYQLPDALKRLTDSGVDFKPGEVQEWMDCGNKDVTVETNRKILKFDWKEQKEMVSPNARIANSIVIPPCYIGDSAIIENSVVGPYVSIGQNSTIANSVVTNSIIQNYSNIDCVNIDNSMIGSHAKFSGTKRNVSLGDYSEINE
jgi:glucose-1-phosphate thymidylyltransferase